MNAADAEHNVIASMIFEPRIAIPEAAEILTAGDFNSPRNAKIFQTVVRMIWRGYHVHHRRRCNKQPRGFSVRSSCIVA